MKISREETMGMLVAVEGWVKRDQAAEWAQWVGYCQHIADRVSKIPGVTAIVRKEMGEGRSNRSPRLMIRWDSAKLGLTGQTASDLLYAGEPRIALGAGGGGGRGDEQVPGDTGISINASTMVPGEEKIVADKVFEVLSAKHTLKPAEAPKPPAADVSGQWEVDITYAASKGTHTLYLQQKGNELVGTQQGEFMTRDILGRISGDEVTLASRITERVGFSLNYTFTGKVAGDGLSGTLELGEYRGATWTARRHKFGAPTGPA
jgi:L-seryl-tRNA(Ser) seleniumtransferase